MLSAQVSDFQNGPVMPEGHRMTSSPLLMSPHTFETLLGSVPSAFFTLDSQGRITYVNALAARLVHRSRDSLLSCNFRQEFGIFLTDRWDQACQTARTEQRTVEYEVHSISLVGWFRLFLTPLEDGLVVHIKDTTEFNQMVQLQRVGSALATCTTPEEVIDVALTQAVSMMGAYLAAVFELNIDSEHLDLMGDIGYSEVLRTTAKRIPLTQNFPPCEAVREGTAVFVFGEALDQRYIGHAEIRSSLTRSLASLPLIVEGRARGALVLSFQTEQKFARPAQEFMLAFALQCAQALERVRGRQVIDDSREHLAFLAAASALLATSLNIRETLQRLGQLAVENMADWATVFLPDEHGQLQLMTAVHRDPDQRALLNTFMDQYPLNMTEQYGVVQVYRTGQSSLISTVPVHVIDAVPDNDKRQMLRRLKLDSLITVPLVTRGRVIGAMAFASSGKHRVYTQADLELAEELARRAASTIENAQLFLTAQDGEARLAGIIGTVTDAVITSDEEGIIVLFNAAAEQMFCVEACEALGQPIERFRPHHSSDEPPAPSFGGTAVEHRMFAARADGSNFPVEEITSEVVVRGQRLFTSVLRDVTARLEAERTLRNSEARFRSTFDQAAVGIGVPPILHTCG
ncbi:GAF domain-containing protein [Deinococcus oregonensis]|uniref:GAF domain-containing protein n=1 Tax=Deinococcus oregonensis TaxID=1805970 RepID=A0ABV6B440_9DEIO